MGIDDEIMLAARPLHDHFCGLPCYKREAHVKDLAEAIQEVVEEMFPPDEED